MSGEAGEAQTAGFLIALRAKGETAEELAGLAQTVRARAEQVTPPGGPFIDTCGTGGGRLTTFNISTTAAFVIAGAGAPVAKHGNRSITSKAGSADVLAALGVRLDIDARQVAACIDQAGIGFCYAVNHHPAMRHAIGPRRELASGARMLDDVRRHRFRDEMRDLRSSGVPELRERSHDHAQRAQCAHGPHSHQGEGQGPRAVRAIILRCFPANRKPPPPSRGHASLENAFLFS
jgi:hypothetical protein